jgi:hypothetical protein
MPSSHFEHLENRCNLLIQRFLDPAIAAEQAALQNGMPVPQPNFDDFAAFRLLTHAELEGYFESKALDVLTALDTIFKNGQVLTSRFVALIYLYLWREKRQPSWPVVQGDDPQSRQQDAAYTKQLAQEALGFGRQFVAANNGIKESSIHVLSAVMGFFPDELDQVLVSELNQYGKKRGDVAHKSWHFKTQTFESADIEKNRLTTILSLTKAFYES